VKALGIKQVLSPPRSPWQSAYVERSSGPFAASAWITSWYSANALCIGHSRRTALITIGGELTWRSTKTRRRPEEYSLQQRVLWRSFVKWAVCIITTNAALPNTQPMRRQHRIECLQNNRRLRGVLRRPPGLCATRHF
jgi:hypothetical protein